MLVRGEWAIWVNMDSQHKGINLQNVRICNFNLQTFASKFTLCILLYLLLYFIKLLIGKYININKHN